MSAETPGRAARDAVVEVALLVMCVFWALNVVTLKWLLGVLDHASLYIFVDILMSGMFAWVLLGEHFGPLRLLGALIILGGVALARSGEKA